MTSAPILSVKGLCVHAPGGRPLLRDLGLTLGRERVALVGRNGVGKSSLLEILAGNELPSRGRVVCDGPRILVPQALPPTLGLSPGQTRQKALDEARRARPELLLLDEPTRDLDRESVDWLIGWITEWKAALIVVTHDRRLLRHFSEFCVVAESGCRGFSGSFDALVADLARVNQDNAHEYAQNLRRLLDEERHTERVRRRRARKKNVGRIRELGRCPSRIRLNGKRSYKQVSQATRALLQAARISSMRDRALSTRRALSVELRLELVLPVLPPDAGQPNVLLEQVSARAGDRTLFEALDLEIGRERIAVTGPNGCGKTTLLDLALQRRKPDAGRARARMERVGFVTQNAGNWCLEESLVDLLAATREHAAELLDAHQFPFALALRPLGSLSPGERVRAALIGLFRRRPAIELLVLDEPTDDLDLQATLALESVLRTWRGGLLIASHDPFLLDAIGITRRIELDGNGSVRVR